MQEINSFAEGVIEDLEPQQGGLQAFLGGSILFRAVLFVCEILLSQLMLLAFVSFLGSFCQV